MALPDLAQQQEDPRLARLRTRVQQRAVLPELPEVGDPRLERLRQRVQQRSAPTAEVATTPAPPPPTFASRVRDFGAGIARRLGRTGGVVGAEADHALVPRAPAFDEPAFQRWYGDIATQNQLDPDPDNPLHFYDYRAAYRAGAAPDPADGHWPSEFKREGHPNLIVDGRDTRTGRSVPAIRPEPVAPAPVLDPIARRLAAPGIPGMNTIPVAEAARLTAPLPEPVPRTQFERGIRTGLESGRVGIGETMETVGGVTDAPEMVALGQGLSAMGRERQQAAPGRVQRVEDWHSLKDFADWASFSMGQGIGSMAAPMVGGVAGGAVAGAPGAMVGALGPSYVMMLGEVRGALESAGDIDPAIVDKWAPLVAVPAAALEALLPGTIGKRAVTGVSVRFGRALAVLVAKRAAQGMLTEGGTEFLQDAIARSATAALSESTDLLTPETASSLLNSLLAGALPGTAFGAVGAVTEGGGTAPAPTTPPQATPPTPATPRRRNAAGYEALRTAEDARRLAQAEAAIGPAAPRGIAGAFARMEAGPEPTAPDDLDAAVAAAQARTDAAREAWLAARRAVTPAPAEQQEPDLALYLKGKETGRLMAEAEWAEAQAAFAAARATPAAPVAPASPTPVAVDPREDEQEREREADPDVIPDLGGPTRPREPFVRPEITPSAVGPVLEQMAEIDRREGEAAGATPSTPSTPVPRYIRGDRVEFTGRTRDTAGATFHEYRFVEGHQQGQAGWTQQGPGAAPAAPVQAEPKPVTPQVPPAPKKESAADRRRAERARVEVEGDPNGTFDERMRYEKRARAAFAGLEERVAAAKAAEEAEAAAAPRTVEAAQAPAPAPAPTAKPKVRKPRKNEERVGDWVLPKQRRETVYDPAALAAYFTPGEIVEAYGDVPDRVISYDPKGGIGGGIGVVVQRVDAEGNPTEPVRGPHGTYPNRETLERVLRKRGAWPGEVAPAAVPAPPDALATASGLSPEDRTANKEVAASERAGTTITAQAVADFARNKKTTVEDAAKRLAKAGYTVPQEAVDAARAEVAPAADPITAAAERIADALVTAIEARVAPVAAQPTATPPPTTTPAAPLPKPKTTVKGIAYYRTEADAQRVGESIEAEHPGFRIREYGRGWAVQFGPSESYFPGLPPVEEAPAAAVEARPADPAETAMLAKLREVPPIVLAGREIHVGRETKRVVRSSGWEARKRTAAKEAGATWDDLAKGAVADGLLSKERAIDLGLDRKLAEDSRQDFLLAGGKPANDEESRVRETATAAAEGASDTIARLAAGDLTLARKEVEAAARAALTAGSSVTVGDATVQIIREGGMFKVPFGEGGGSTIADTRAAATNDAVSRAVAAWDDIASTARIARGAETQADAEALYKDAFAAGEERGGGGTKSALAEVAQARGMVSPLTGVLYRLADATFGYHYGAGKPEAPTFVEAVAAMEESLLKQAQPGQPEGSLNRFQAQQVDKTDAARAEKLDGMADAMEALTGATSPATDAARAAAKDTRGEIDARDVRVKQAADEAATVLALVPVTRAQTAIPLAEHRTTVPRGWDSTVSTEASPIITDGKMAVVKAAIVKKWQARLATMEKRRDSQRRTLDFDQKHQVWAEAIKGATEPVQVLGVIPIDGTNEMQVPVAVVETAGDVSTFDADRLRLLSDLTAYDELRGPQASHRDRLPVVAFRGGKAVGLLMPRPGQAAIDLPTMRTKLGLPPAAAPAEKPLVTPEDTAPASDQTDAEPQTGLDAAAADAAARLAARRQGRLSFGVDPADLIDLSIIGAAKFVRGAKTVAAWSRAMIDDFGSSIQPHLETIRKLALKIVRGEDVDLSALPVDRRAMAEAAIAEIAEGRRVKPADMGGAGERTAPAEATDTKDARELKRRAVRDTLERRRKRVASIADRVGASPKLDAKLWATAEKVVLRALFGKQAQEVIVALRAATTPKSAQKALKRAEAILADKQRKAAVADLGRQLKHAVHLRPEFMAAVDAVAGDVDMVGMGPKTRATLEAAAAYLAQNPDAGVTKALSKQLARLDKVQVNAKDANGEYTLPTDEVVDIANAVRAAIHHSKTANRMQGQERKEYRSDLAEQALGEMAASTDVLPQDQPRNLTPGRGFGKRGLPQGPRRYTLGTIFKEAFTRPEVLVKHLSKTLRRIAYHDIVVEAHAKEGKLAHHFKDVLKTAIETAGFKMGTKEFNDWRKATLELDVPGADGEPLALSRDEAIWLLVSIKDPTNRAYMATNGITFQRQGGLPVKFGEDAIASLREQTGVEERGIAQAMFRQFNGPMKVALNRAWVDVYGYEIANVVDYAPRSIDMDTATTAKDPIEQMANDREPALATWSHTRERVGTKAALEIGGALDTYLNHSGHVARLAAYLAPATNAYAILGRMDVKQAIRARVGDAGLTRILAMIREQTVRQADRSTFDRALRIRMRVLGGSLLALRATTIALAPINLTLSAAYMSGGFGYLGRSLTGAVTPSERKRVIAAAREYSPYWRTRYEGDFVRQVTSGMMDRKSHYGGPGLVEYGLLPLEKADEAVNIIRWQMAEMDVAHRQPDLDPASPEYGNEVARTWELSVFRSDNTAHGGDMTGALAHARANTWFGTFMMFGSSVSKSYSAAADAAMEARAGNLPMATRLFAGSVASLVAASLIREAWAKLKAWDDDDDERKLAERLLTRMATEAAGYIPIFGATVIAPAVRAMAGQTGPIFEASVTEQILHDLGLTAQRLSAAIHQAMTDELNSKGEEVYRETLEKAAWGAAELATGFFNIPYGGPKDLVNISTDLYTILRDKAKGAAPEDATKEEADALERDLNPVVDVEQERNRLMRALVTNNPRAFRDAVTELRAQGVDMDAAEVMAAINRRYGRYTKYEQGKKAREGLTPYALEVFDQQLADRDALRTIARDLSRENRDVLTPGGPTPPPRPTRPRPPRP